MPRAARSTAAAAAPLRRAAASLLAPHPNHHIWAPAPSAMGLSTWIPTPSPTHFVSAPSALNLGLSPSPLSATAPAAAAVSRWTPVYRWIPVVGALITFAWSLAVGANDVATSFGTSVGSKALSMVVAVCLAAVMEITGAALLGDRTIDTFQSTVLKEVPADGTLLMWGLFIAILVATLYLALATRWEIPVSSMLAILGAIIGVSLAGQGFTSIYWNKTSTRLHLGGVLGIILSWIIAPVIAGLVSFALFGFTKLTLLKSPSSEKLLLRALPLYYGVTVLVLLLFIIYRGTPGASLKSMGVGQAFLIAGIGSITAILLTFVIIFLLGLSRMRTSNKIESRLTPDTSFKDTQDGQGNENQADRKKDSEEDLEKAADDLLKQFAERHVLETVYEADEEETGLSPQSNVECGPSCAPRVTFQQLLSQTSNRSTFKRMRSRKEVSRKQKILNCLKNLYLSTICHNVDFDQATKSRHFLAEKFDSKTEELFSILQILTACVAAFSHGSNEVVEILNPLASILQLYNHHDNLAAHASVPVWVLLLGGAGVSCGFALWGWKIIRCIGGGITYMSPSRGYCAQISAVAIGLLATRANLPVSTTHILIGSVIGVGLADNAKNVNWRLLMILVPAWLATLVFSSTTAAGFYSFTIYSPSYSGG